MQLIEISALNDSGGGFLHRLFDGHPQLDVWPFELLLGNDSVSPDGFSPDWFRGRFRWPRLTGLSAENGATLFNQISDSELKHVLTDPDNARHRGFAVPVSLDAWRDRVAAAWLASHEHSQSRFVSIYVQAFFELARQDYEPAVAVLGHCPTIVLDAEQLWADFPTAKMLHVIRSPIAGFVDMCQRHKQLSPTDYAKKWSLINGMAATIAVKYPERIRLLTLDMLVSDRAATMVELCAWLGLNAPEILQTPTWSGIALDPQNMGPFGGVPSVRAGRDAQLIETMATSTAEPITRLTAGTRQLLAETSDGRAYYPD
jgi:hypothetical protein